jgi:hypothetical protein
MFDFDYFNYLNNQIKMFLNYAPTITFFAGNSYSLYELYQYEELLRLAHHIESPSFTLTQAQKHNLRAKCAFVITNVLTVGMVVWLL